QNYETGHSVGHRSQFVGEVRSVQDGWVEVETKNKFSDDGQPEDTAAAVVDFMLTHAGSVATAEPADRDGAVSAQTVARRLRAIR
ncbi:MAG: hypothetical protein ACEQSX_14950, partial [Baekduiaceae bacterium]